MLRFICFFPFRGQPCFHCPSWLEHGRVSDIFPFGFDFDSIHVFFALPPFKLEICRGTWLLVFVGLWRFIIGGRILIVTCVA